MKQIVCWTWVQRRHHADCQVFAPRTADHHVFGHDAPEDSRPGTHHLRDPVEVKLAVSKPADKIVQSAYVCYEAQKVSLVKKLFAERPPHRVIIFASSKLKVKDMAIALGRAGFKVGAMHSDLEQQERDEVMYKFKAQQIDVLVATDIVARGIDIDDIQLVINFDVPHDAEDYVHRIGRTARANNDGEAITLVSEKDQQRLLPLSISLKPK